MESLQDSAKKEKAYDKKHKYVDLKKERTSFKEDPYLPFQNARVTKDYYVVPVVQPCSKVALRDQIQRIGLSI